MRKLKLKYRKAVEMASQETQSEFTTCVINIKSELSICARTTCSASAYRGDRLMPRAHASGNRVVALQSSLQHGCLRAVGVRRR